ncbi:hybrid sensor histidine kinase/response regulator [Halopseudomonas oceani]|uniref:Sensory/regulatory protein RpfC n=1 Tax=Halopseudomonas oceani TaxID=1708783 RepID=A0A2P4EQN6_9GAMM|nr:hybrid sensor histidine kinase/response regulator [Halopseudomonas oceani]POB00915.1 hybrid sensor histidine kinase/response regulator [Halopseudomonas oceani]GGE46131.1 hybrid sensor histidine kinase/response regulator [Halopseudomonas oceani]
MRFCHVFMLCWLVLGFATGTLANTEPSHNQQAVGVDISESRERLSLGPNLLILEDPQGSLTLQQLLRSHSLYPWRAITGEHVNEGKDHSVWWVQFALTNNRQTPIEGVIEIDYALLDNLTLYQIQPDGPPLVQQGGDHLPQNERAVAVRNHWFPVSLPPGTSRFYLRVDTTSTVFLPIYFADWATSSAQLESSMLAAGLFYGILLGLFAYNLFLQISLREATYAWYLTHILNIMLFMACFDGLLWKWVTISIPIQTLCIYTLMFLHCAVSTQFSRHYLHTREQFPRLDRVLRCKIVIVLAAMAIIPLFSIDLYNNMASLFVLVSSMILLGTGIYVWRKGFRYGSYYTLAWGFLLCALIVSTAGSLGFELLGASYGTHWVKFGMCAEMIILSLGLADRINALKEARYKADEAARQARLETLAQSRFLARMSHEIRTPMNGVLGMLQLLQDTRLDNQQRFYIDTISKSGHTLLTVINDILDFARLESGRVKLETIAFDPEELVSETASLFTAQTLEKHLGLYCTISPDLPEHLIGDPTRLKQVLMNLLSNAFKFTAKGHVSVFVTGVPRNQARDSWDIRFEVRDTGIGIARDAQTSLFDSFTQADSSTTRRYGGTGLGLAISQELVRLMGGSISLDSDAEKGTCMYFSVPLGSSSSALPSAQSKRALVITRQTEARQHYQSQLERLGFSVQHSDASSTEAPTQPADLVMLDTQDIPTDRLQQLLHQCAQEAIPVLLLRNADDSRQLVWQGQVVEQSLPLLPSQLRKTLIRLNNSAEQHTPPAAQPSKEQRRGRGHLLVAEDNQVNQLVVKTLLEKAGYSVEITENGQEALSSYRDDPDHYDLILMDCEMPEMDGFEATRRIRAHEQREHLPRTPIVALTAHVLDTHRLEGMAAGMDDYLSKPVDSEQLYASLQRLIRSRATH